MGKGEMALPQGDFLSAVCQWEDCQDGAFLPNWHIHEYGITFDNTPCVRFRKRSRAIKKRK